MTTIQSNISESLLDKIISWLKKAVTVVPAVIATASAVTAIIPQAAPEYAILATAQKVLDVLALNIGNNSKSTATAPTTVPGDETTTVDASIVPSNGV